MLRSYPHAVLSWRYLLPNQSKATLQHRKAFLGAWYMLPRSVWAAIAIYSTSKWYLWSGWLALYQVVINLRPKLINKPQKNLGKEIIHLWWLTFAHNIPPYYYYSYQLYNYAEKDWLNFVYTHELPHWHHLLSPSLSKKELELITDKQVFSKKMLEAGLPAIPTLLYLEPSDTLTHNDIFKEKSLFIKPTIGSQKRDCYELLWAPRERSYRLLGKSELNEKEKIFSELKNLLLKKPILIQPLLQNHNFIAPYCPKGLLACIRLVTIKKPSRTHIMDAILQIPLTTSHNAISPYRIHIESGALELINPSSVELTEAQENAQHSKLNGLAVPMWDKAIKSAKLAHDSFPNILTIGWDIGITPNGVFLIEGNINWAVEMHQENYKPLWEQYYGTKEWN